MQNSSASAYVIPAGQFVRFFQGKDRAEFERLLADDNIVGLRNFLGANSSENGPDDVTHWPEGFPELEDVFTLADEDESDSLERGVIYLQFDESSLYHKTPTEAMRILTANNVKPEFERWIVFG